jgi:dihydroorotate dehydrogenase (NAD+) catalytic subunit
LIAAVDIGSLRLEHPVVNGSGTFDAIAARRAFGEALWDRFPFSAFVSKTITIELRAGNPPPRLCETPAGLINSIGLPNRGLDGFLATDLPLLATLPVPLVVSVMAASRDGFARLVGGVGARREVDAIELNVSCPNVDDVPASVGEIVGAARAATRKPLYTKLSPATADIAEVALAAQKAGTDGLSLVNTILGLALDERTLRPLLSRTAGGLSGPALKPIALAAVYTCYAATGLPVVGMGGIASGRDALEFVAAGASNVAIGTILFSDPDAAGRIRAELASRIASLGVGALDNAIGLAHAEPLLSSETARCPASMSS